MSTPLQETRFSYDDIPDQTGRTVLVTGANGGLGLQTARTLAHNGARVLMACRNPQKAQEAVAEVTAWARGPEPESIPLDLADLSSVRAAARRVGELTDSLDVLVNNAGLMAVPLARTADGFEMQLGTNYLGHVALTDALLPLLLAAPAPRVVNEASVAHRWGAISLDDPNYDRRRYWKWSAYGQSKLACLLFTVELARRAARTPLLPVTAHPGVAATSLFEHLVPPVPGAEKVVELGAGVVLNSAEDGALSQLYAATMPDVEPDDYLGPTRFGGVRGPVARSPRSSAGSDGELARQLWDVACELTGSTFESLPA